MVHSLQELYSRPINIVFVEYPGYYQAPGDASQESILQQSLKVYDYLKSQSDLPIFAFGQSLGAGTATYLASKKKVAGLILQTPYTSISDIAANRYPIFPVKWLLIHPFLAENWAPKVTAPVIAIHGTKDLSIPFENAKRQFENFTADKIFVTVEGAGHDTESLQDSPLYWPPILQLIDRVIN